MGLRNAQASNIEANLSDKKKIFEANVNMNVKVMDYDRNIIDGLSPDIKDFNGLIENNSPTANFLSQDIKQTNSEIVPPIRMPSQEFNQN